MMLKIVLITAVPTVPVRQQQQTAFLGILRWWSWCKIQFFSISTVC